MHELQPNLPVETMRKADNCSCSLPAALGLASLFAAVRIYRRRPTRTWICRRIQPSLPLLLLTVTCRLVGGAHCTRRDWMLMRPPVGDGIAICRRLSP